MISIEKAIKFPFAQNDWQKTVGIYFLTTLVIAVITFMLQLVFQVPSDILEAIAKESGDQSIYLFAQGIGAFYIVVSSIVSILIFPVTLYLNGYTFDVIRHIVYGKDPAITPHGNYAFRLKLGAVRIVITTILGLFAFILLFIPGLTGLAGVLSLESIPVLGTLLIAIAGVISVAWILFLVLGLKLMQFAMEYLYLTKGFKFIFNPPQLLAIVSKNIKPFLILYALEILGTVLMSFIFVICCVIPIIYPVISTIFAFAISYYYGMTYREIREQ
ncbi:hypothetical protein HYV12_00645 [Candidatus Dojkabacteria bacterium]|nr:hypothetical protein [Candidatus Dojkabacteria bacterium]